MDIAEHVAKWAAFDSKDEIFKHYRVDGTKNIQISALDREGIEQLKQIAMARYTAQTFSMLGGEVERRTLAFPNRFIGVVIARFGQDIPLRKQKTNIFKCLLKQP